jgi:uncharacterized oxidoreductase
MKSIAGQDVLITGGSAGIGLAIAKGMLALGARVGICARDADRLKAVTQEVPGLHTFVADVGRTADLRRLTAEVAERFGGLSILVNNAGIQYQYRFPNAPTDEVLEKVDYELSVNFGGMVKLTTLLLPKLLEAPEAVIVNVSSSLAITPKASAPVYCATKAAVHSFSRSLRYQLEDAESRVAVLDVMPPLVDTAMTAGRWQGKLRPVDVAEAVIDAILEGREVLKLGDAAHLDILNRLAPEFAARRVRG